MMTLFIVFCMLCSGCISEDGTPATTVAPTTLPPTTTVTPTTVPPNVITTPLYASDLQEKMAEAEIAYAAAPANQQERLEALQALLDDHDPDYEEIYEAYTDYEAAVLEYQYVLYRYYHTSILLEHTTPIEGDLLALKKDTLPFGRPHGDMYTFGELNMKGEDYESYTDRLIKKLILKGIDGEDTRDEIIGGLEAFEEFLTGYHDMIIGYLYYDLSTILFRQSLYSDILIHDCNPTCI
ncbi:MAG TPA: hypothetical protein ENN11_00985 [Methanomicrobia archaeon]|nr:hypothetical protein [Methanomicrobia archaeon]